MALLADVALLCLVFAFGHTVGYVRGFWAGWTAYSLRQGHPPSDPDDWT